MTLSVSLYLFAMQALLPQFLTPCIQLFLFLFGQIPFAICDLFFHIAGMGVYQRVQHDLRRVQQKDTVPFLAVRLPSQQRIAVTGRYDFIQRAGLAGEYRQRPAKSDQSSASYSPSSSKINSDNIVSSACAFNVFIRPTHRI